MDALKNLPAPLRTGIPIALVLALGLVAWMTMFRAPAPRDVLSTRDIAVVETAKTVLDSRQISYDTLDEGGTFKLLVPQGDSMEAAEALAKSGIKDYRTDLVKKVTCPAAPGFTATKAANERADNCEDERSVQAMLLTAGAIAVNIKVSQQENETLLGPESSKNIVAQVFLPEYMKGKWDAEQAARAISRAVGTSLDRVSITDDDLQTLFDGSSNAGAATARSGQGLGSLGCDDIATATEVETKKAAVRSCYKGTIGDELTELLGGSDRFVLTVEPTIQSAATTTTSIRNTPGPVVDKSTQSGGGSKVADISSPANTSETTKVSPAGAISSLRITATLDKDAVSQDQVLAVKRVLSAYVDPRRGDPAPTVTLSKFAGGAGDKPTNEDLQAIQAAASQDRDAADVATMPAPRPEVPVWAKALMGVLVAAALGALLALWRRSAAMAAERARLEESFQREQRLFEDFAQQNPDHLARDLNALFGAPSAPEPTYR